ncbi:MAG TPA: hypothetical protein VEN28_08585, partial [Burkholderiaceae bacterium]|nr:hypothetical protein [Burkholderiaceae bacterium]
NSCADVEAAGRATPSTWFACAYVASGKRSDLLRRSDDHFRPGDNETWGASSSPDAAVETRSKG